MVTNNEITPVSKSDIVASTNTDKHKSEIVPVGSSNSGLGPESSIPLFNKILVTYDASKKSDKAIEYSIYLSNMSS